MNARAFDISVVVPVGLRTASAACLVTQYKEALTQLNKKFEFIFVLDGPNWAYANELRKVVEAGEPLTVIGLSRSCGESSAVMAGMRHAQAQTILILPAYHQIDPTEIPNIFAQFTGVDLIVCHRTPRRGTWFDHIRRKTFHWLVKKITGADHNDLGCGVRVFNRQVIEEIKVYGEQIRFLSLLATKAGFKAKEVKVTQSKDDHNYQRYSFRTYLQSALDLFNVFFLIRFTKKPLRFFGMSGLLLVLSGLLLSGWILFERLFLGVPLGERPAFILSSLTLVLGLQVIAIGLLGELLIFTHAGDTDEFRIESIIAIHDPEVPHS